MATEDQLSRVAAAAAAAAVAAAENRTAPQARGGSNDKPKQDEAKAPATYEENLAAAAQRIRDTAKWLVAAFAAVGALLIAGMQLKDLGALEGPDAWLAAIGAALGIAGVIVVVFCAAAVLAAGRLPLADVVGDPPRRADIRERLQRSPNLYQPFDSIDEFHEKLSDSWRQQATAFIDYNDESKSLADREAAGRRYQSTLVFVRQFNPLNRRLLATAEYENVRARWDQSRKVIAAGIVVCAVGAGLFAYTSAPDDDETATPAVMASPARAFLHLSESGRDEFAAVLGKQCTTRNLPVLALGRTNGNYDLVTDPASPDCDVRRIEVSDSEGEVTGTPLPPFEPPD
jgi:hypothetical protein